MKCNEVLQHLNEYIENDLDERVMDEIRGHMEECSECRKVYEEEKELNDMFLEALNSEPIEFNSRIGNIMNMIDKDKYSSQEKNQVNEPDEDSKVIEFESVNKKKQKKIIFNKKVIAMAASFTIMIFMAPFIIGEKKNDMEYASKENMKTRSFDESKNDSDKDYDMASNKETEESGFNVSVQNSEEKNEEIDESKLNEDVAAVQASDDGVNNNNENSEAEPITNFSVLDKNRSALMVNYTVENKAEDLEKEHKIILNNEKSTTIELNNQQEDLGILEGVITSYVKDDEYVYIACVGIDTENQAKTSKIIKVNIKTNKIDILYTSLINESVIELELKEEKIKFTTNTGEDQEKIQSIKK